MPRWLNCVFGWPPIQRLHRPPDHALSDGAGAGLAAKKESVHAAERDTQRVKDLRRVCVEALRAEDSTCFKSVDEMRTAHLGPAPT